MFAIETSKVRSKGFTDYREDDRNAIAHVQNIIQGDVEGLTYTQPMSNVHHAICVRNKGLDRPLVLSRRLCFSGIRQGL